MHRVSDGRQVVGSLEDLLHELRRKGILLWKDEAGLRFRAPKGALTAEERQLLSRANEEIASLLERHSRSSNRDSSVGRGTGAHRAPLSFTQLEHWHDRLRYGSRPIRHLASEFRIQGPLRLEFLKESVSAIGRRHDALRTRIILHEGQFPVQEVDDKYRPELEIISLRSVPESRRTTEIERQVKRAILDADDYAVSPLFKAVLLAIDAEEHVLILAMDHMISDLASLHLVSGEIFTAYAQLFKECPIDLPPVPIQFSDHAIRLCAQPVEMLTRICRRMDPIGRIRFPDTLQGRVSSGRTNPGSAQFVICRDAANDLRAWARRHGTTVVIATLTAYAALVLRWCRVREVVIRFMIDGRTSAELEHTIGYLAFAVYVRVVLDNRSNFIDLLDVVTEEYCRARDEADFGYALSQQVRPEFTRNTGVNWLPSGGPTGGALMPDMDVVLCRSPVEFSEMMLPWIGECDQDAEPGVSFYERAGAIVCQVGYAPKRFSDSSMARFGVNIVEFLGVMMRAPTRRVMDVELK